MTRPSVDFKRLKEVTFEQAVAFLTELGEPKWEKGEMRFGCPACGIDERKRALAVHPTDGFTCYAHGKKSGRDATALVAHVRGITNYEAGRLLQEHFFGTQQPASRAPSPASSKVGLEGRSDDLAQMLGITPAAMQALGAEQGDRLVIPLRKADGAQIGTLGIATKADQSPLLAFDFDEEATAPQKRGQDELRKLFRVVS